jgi:YidC/Oxa1 family membrane protein insertase
MENLRTIFWALFACMAFLTWTQWQTDHELAPGTEQIAETAALAEQNADYLLPVDSAMQRSPALDPALPQLSEAASEQPPVIASPSPASPMPAVTDAPFITINTDVFELQISLRGGTLINAKLKKYPVSKDNPDMPVELLSSAPENIYTIASGIVDGNRSGPTHLATLAASSSSFVMSGDTLEVPLTWSSPEGVQVKKIFRFFRGRYNIDIEYRIRNGSNSDWRALSYVQIRKLNNPPERSMFDVDTYSYDGPIYYDGEKYEKVDPDDLADEPLKLIAAGGWIASIEHHFLTAVIPPPEQDYSYDANFTNQVITVRASGPANVVPAGDEAVIIDQVFVGPKLQDELSETAPGLELTVDYGLLALLAKPLFWLLQQVHGFVGNWGWSIILVTFLIKLAFYKLTEASGRSMAKMRKLQPRLKTLQERYKDDRQALSTHMMELYKREKVNPAAGCLPMLIQIPFFIAFYWVLLESVEMRQAPFILWITDLSSRDPFFVLPLLMGIAMFIQQKLNPAPPDPVQAKVMSILPVMFTVFFAFFPAGLVLYWLTNSVLSIIQQWNINRKLGVD